MSDKFVLINDDSGKNTGSNKKYILTNDTVYIECNRNGTDVKVPLYRIQAVRDFGDVKKGDKGGFVEHDENLSHRGDCWIYDMALVYDEAQIKGNAKVSDRAQVYDNAEVWGDAQVYGNAKVYGDVEVYNNAKVYGNVEVMFRMGDGEISENKYTLTDEAINVDGHTLYRIKALKNFRNVKKGDKGGYVESYANLAQNGDCWVADNAKVYGGAWVCGNAWVSGNAQVCTAVVFDEAKVYGNAKIYGYARVYGDAKVYGNARVNGEACVCHEDVTNNRYAEEYDDEY